MTTLQLIAHLYGHYARISATYLITNGIYKHSYMMYQLQEGGGTEREINPAAERASSSTYNKAVVTFPQMCYSPKISKEMVAAFQFTLQHSKSIIQMSQQLPHLWLLVGGIKMPKLV